jgi:hypothetical protein
MAYHRCFGLPPGGRSGNLCALFGFTFMKIIVAAVMFLSVGWWCALAADGGGAAKLEFTTETLGPGKYAPKHVVAVWVADANTNFIKSVMRLGNKRHTKLHTWNKARQGDNEVDGVTGATVTEHQSHTATWNGTDASGKPLPDGTYLFCVEFTENNNQGPVAMIPFTKGAKAENHDVQAGPKGFKALKVIFTPPAK